MAHAQKRPKKAEETHTRLAVQVETYEVSLEAEVNHHVYSPECAWRPIDDDPLFAFDNRLIVTGTAIYPNERSEDTYELTLYGTDAPSFNLAARMKDAQARGEYGAPLYRSYRGREIPVYEPPKGIALIEKTRGQARWTAWAPVVPRFVSDCLVLLDRDTPLYLAIHECKEAQHRWIQSLSLQTNDPREE